MKYWMIDNGGLRYVVLQAQKLDTAVRRAARTLCAEHKIDKNYQATFNVRRISKSEYESEINDVGMIETDNEQPMTEACCVCGNTDNVTYTTDPYASEIKGDDTEMWLCADCIYESKMEI